MSAAKYPHSRHVQAGRAVRLGVFAGASKPVKNILRLHWPRFPYYGPHGPVDSKIYAGPLTAKKWRRARYWSKQAERRKYKPWLHRK